ncbi:hypothetical protein GE061_000865 [Apolygus lucorum]|uniref:Uncharacterized protein n=1 Tax=Apolygus lucorum TaxID=248454 RepID=A0A6A4JY10_APOLU|nr:hypothetical protein GE061_000865 [Apolygus lucorum]
MWKVLFETVVWISMLKVSLGAVIEPKPVEEDHVPSVMLLTGVSRSSLEVNDTQKKPHMDGKKLPRMELTNTVQLKQKLQSSKPVRTAMSSFLLTFAEAVSKAAALPIAVAISLVNKVSNASNSTLHFGGELTKLPVTITNSIIQELSNITYPN